MLVVCYLNQTSSVRCYPLFVGYFRLLITFTNNAVYVVLESFGWRALVTSMYHAVTAFCVTYQTLREVFVVFLDGQSIQKKFGILMNGADTYCVGAASACQNTPFRSQRAKKENPIWTDGYRFLNAVKISFKLHRINCFCLWTFLPMLIQSFLPGIVLENSSS